MWKQSSRDKRIHFYRNRTTFIVLDAQVDQTKPAHHMHSSPKTMHDKHRTWWRCCKKPTKKSTQNCSTWQTDAVVVAVMDLTKLDAMAVSVAVTAVALDAAATATAHEAPDSVIQDPTEISIDRMRRTHGKHSIKSIKIIYCLGSRFTNKKTIFLLLSPCLSVWIPSFFFFLN